MWNFAVENHRAKRRLKTQRERAKRTLASSMIQEFLNGKEPSRLINPDEAASSGVQEFLLLDVTPAQHRHLHTERANVSRWFFLRRFEVLLLAATTQRLLYHSISQPCFFNEFHSISQLRFFSSAGLMVLHRPARD